MVIAAQSERLGDGFVLGQAIQEPISHGVGGEKVDTLTDRSLPADPDLTDRTGLITRC